jgi:carboxyvinyl-carboxyphosphonate phosphorylmutase
MFTQSRQGLRTILNGEGCISPASVFDPISMRVAQDLGFSLAMLAGSTASLAIHGAPDIVIITLTEFADLAARITRASNLPLLVDADHGYGNALNARRCVTELERAGIAGMTLEDTDLPTPFGATKPRLLSHEEGVAKIRAALSARCDPDFVIVGRTSALNFVGLDEAVARGKLYSAAGVDALFFTGVDELAPLHAIRAVTSLPIILGGTKIRDVAGLAALGVRIALRGHQPIQAAIQAVFETMKAQKDGSDLPTLASPALLAQVTREAEYKAAAGQHLGV